MYPYDYKLSLTLRHPKQDLAEIFGELGKISGFNPGRIWKVGDTRETPQGVKLEGTYSESVCGFSFSEVWQKSDKVSPLDEIEKILKGLESFKKNLQTITQSGGKVQLIIALFIDSNSAEMFSPDLLRRLADFEFELWFDIYPPDNLKHKG